ncbi:MAG: hypothetical protein J5875_11455 [Paludibacteraceae bacterium]|nr:hypothetical protein [Paludibacteraceae bacterium]
MRYYLILNYIISTVIYVILFSETKPNGLLLALLTGVSIFLSWKVIGYVRKYYNSKKYFGKSVLGIIILVTEFVEMWPVLIWYLQK